MKEKLLSLTKGGFKNYIMILIGSIIMALGYVIFIIPHKIVPGGVYGLSIVLHYLIGTPTGTTAFVLNIPLLLWGIKELGPRFGAKTVIGLFLTSVFIDSFTFILPKTFYTNDVLMSSVYGGAMIGAGLGIIFKAKATTGGSDIVARILTKHFKSQVGFNLIIIDSIVVLSGIIAFKNFSLALYAVISIFVTGKVVDMVLEGAKYNKAVFIISEKAEEIRKVILKNIKRGGTIFEGKGMYKNSSKKVIFSALNRREVVVVQDYIKAIDPNAFMVVFDVTKILGEGFEKFESND